MLLMSHSTPDLNFKKICFSGENKTLLRFGRKCFSKIFTQSVPICRKIKREPSSYSHLFLFCFCFPSCRVIMNYSTWKRIKYGPLDIWIFSLVLHIWFDQSTQSFSAFELSISPIVYFIKCNQLCYPKYCIFWNWFLSYKYIIDQQGRQIRWKWHEDIQYYFGYYNTELYMIKKDAWNQIFYSSYLRALYVSFPVITLHFHMCAT